jgi:hypothetical protein
MANVVMASKPKRVRSFIINGQIYEGGAEEYYNGSSMGNDLGGATTTDRLAEQTEVNGKESNDK